VDADQAWQSALGQLQMEMPTASFDTWVRPTRLVSFEDGLFTLGAMNTYAREWLESRLEATLLHLLAGVMNDADIRVKFVVGEGLESDVEVDEESASDDIDDDDEEHDGEGEQDFASILQGHSRYLTAYEKIVKPHKIILVPGYLVRLLPERGAAAVFAYIGFSQVAWMNSSRRNDNDRVTFRALMVSVAKFAGTNRTAFYRLMKRASFWKSLEGLVEKEETGKKHILYRTLPLSRADAQELANWLRAKMALGESLEEALQAAASVPTGNLVGVILSDVYKQRGLTIDPAVPTRVPDLARYVAGGRQLSHAEAEAAENLHVRIVYAFKDLVLRHFFVTDVIREARLSPAQAALILVSRYRCYANPGTGEVINTLIAPDGYREMASWIGLSRPKTISEWLDGNSRELVDRRSDGTPNLQTVKKGGVPGFLKEVGNSSGKKKSERTIRVRLLEPIDFGSQDDGESSLAAWEPEEDKLAYVLAMRQALPSDGQAGDQNGPASRDCWSLDTLMSHAGVFPKVREKLTAAGVDAAHFLAWIYFCHSRLNTSKYRINAYPAKMLGENQASSPGPGFARLASLPPSVIRMCIEATLSGNFTAERIGFPDWDDLIGGSISQVKELKKFLFG
jgi:hypothetical protein